MDEGARKCDTDNLNSLSVNNYSTYSEEINIRINTNYCHLHHWHMQSVTDDLQAYTLTKFQPFNHVSFCQVCSSKVLLCPVCDEIVYGTVKMTCRIIIAQ